MAKQQTETTTTMALTSNELSLLRERGLSIKDPKAVEFLETIRAEKKKKSDESGGQMITEESTIGDLAKQLEDQEEWCVEFFDRLGELDTKLYELREITSKMQHQLDRIDGRVEQISEFLLELKRDEVT